MYKEMLNHITIIHIERRDVCPTLNPL